MSDSHILIGPHADRIRHEYSLDEFFAKGSSAELYRYDQ